MVSMTTTDPNIACSQLLFDGQFEVPHLRPLRVCDSGVPDLRFGAGCGGRRDYSDGFGRHVHGAVAVDCQAVLPLLTPVNPAITVARGAGRTACTI